MAISNNSTGLRPGVCTSTTRPTAPYTGQGIYETDTGIQYVWNGSAWVVNYVSAASPAFTGTPTAPTAAAGTNTTQLATTAFVTAADSLAGGLVYITSGALSGAATSFVGCFSSTYDNYKVVVQTLKTSSAIDIYIRMLHGSTPLANSSYYYNVFGYDNNGTFINQPSVGLTNAMYSGASTNSTTQASLVYDVMTPNLTKNTTWIGNAVSFASYWRSKSVHDLQQDDESFDGFQLTTLSTPTMTGTVTIYGYKK